MFRVKDRGFILGAGTYVAYNLHVNVSLQEAGEQQELHIKNHLERKISIYAVQGTSYSRLSCDVQQSRELRVVGGCSTPCPSFPHITSTDSTTLTELITSRNGEPATGAAARPPGRSVFPGLSPKTAGSDPWLRLLVPHPARWALGRPSLSWGKNIKP